MRRVRRNVDRHRDDGMPWILYDVNDNYTPDWLPVYNRRRGLLVDTANFDPVDYFQVFFSVKNFTNT